MYDLRRVLAATDGSEHGLKAVVTAASCAERARARLDVVSVVEVLLLPLGVDAAAYHDAFADATRTRVEAQLKEAGLADTPFHLRKGMAAATIGEVAEELDADLIVVGAHPKPAVARFLVGSTAERVIRLARRPVLVATAPGREPYRRIVVSVDLSPQSERVLEVAVALATACGAEMRAVYVEDRLTPMLLEAALVDEKETRHHARSQLQKTLAAVSVPSELMVSREVREGHAGHEILRAAEEWDADLVVMGTHGFGFINRLLLGSVSTYVLRHGDRDTLVVPRAESAGAEAEEGAGTG
jgi:nucleotide-binding universal stress UspA family protein